MKFWQGILLFLMTELVLILLVAVLPDGIFRGLAVILVVVVLLFLVGLVANALFNYEVKTKDPSDNTNI